MADAYQAVAREEALGGDRDIARRHQQVAEARDARIVDDRTIFHADLQRGPWCAVNPQGAR